MTEMNEVDSLYDDLLEDGIEENQSDNTDRRIQSPTRMDVDVSDADIYNRSSYSIHGHHGIKDKGCTDLDLYDDILVEQDRDERESYEQMLQKFRDAMETISKLQAEKTELESSLTEVKATSENAQRNISSILLTARAEMKRKDTEITRLRKQLTNKSSQTPNRYRQHRLLRRSPGADPQSPSSHDNRPSSDTDSSQKWLPRSRNQSLSNTRSGSCRKADDLRAHRSADESRDSENEGSRSCRTRNLESDSGYNRRDSEWEASRRYRAKDVDRATDRTLGSDSESRDRISRTNNRDKSENDSKGRNLNENEESQRGEKHLDEKSKYRHDRTDRRKLAERDGVSGKEREERTAHRNPSIGHEELRKDRNPENRIMCDNKDTATDKSTHTKPDRKTSTLHDRKSNTQDTEIDGQSRTENPSNCDKIADKDDVALNERSEGSLKDTDKGQLSSQTPDKTNTRSKSREKSSSKKSESQRNQRKRSRSVERKGEKDRVKDVEKRHKNDESEIRSKDRTKMDEKQKTRGNDKEGNNCENNNKTDGVFDLRQKLKSRNRNPEIQNLQHREEKHESQHSKDAGWPGGIQKRTSIQERLGHMANNSIKMSEKSKLFGSDEKKNTEVEKMKTGLRRNVVKEKPCDLDDDRNFLTMLQKSTCEKDRLHEGSAKTTGSFTMKQQSSIQGKDSARAKLCKSNESREVVDYCDIELSGYSNVDINSVKLMQRLTGESQQTSKSQEKNYQCKKSNTFWETASVLETESAPDRTKEEIEQFHSKTGASARISQESQSGVDCEMLEQSIKSSDTSLLYGSIGEEACFSDGPYDNEEDSFDAEIFAVGTDSKTTEASKGIRNGNIGDEENVKDVCENVKNKISVDNAEPILHSETIKTTRKQFEQKSEVEKESCEMVVKKNGSERESEYEPCDSNNVSQASSRDLTCASTIGKRRSSRLQAQNSQSAAAVSDNIEEDVEGQRKAENGESGHVDKQNKSFEREEGEIAATSPRGSDRGRSSEEKRTRKGMRKSRDSDSHKPYRRVISETISSVTSCEVTQMEAVLQMSKSPHKSPNKICGKLNCSIKVNHLHPKSPTNISPNKGKNLDIPHVEDANKDALNVLSPGKEKENPVNEVKRSYGEKDIEHPENNCSFENIIPNGNTEDDTSTMPTYSDNRNDAIVLENGQIVGETLENKEKDMNQPVAPATEAVSLDSSGSFGSNILTEKTKSPASLNTSDSESEDYTGSESDSSIDSGNEDPSFENFTTTVESFACDENDNKVTKVAAVSMPESKASAETLSNEKTEASSKSVKIPISNQKKQISNKDETKQSVKPVDVNKQAEKTVEHQDGKDGVSRADRSKPAGVSSMHDILNQPPDRSFLLQSLLCGVDSVMKAKKTDTETTHTDEQSNNLNRNHDSLVKGSSKKLEEIDLFGSLSSSSDSSCSSLSSDSDSEFDSSDGSSCSCDSCSCGGSSSSSTFSDDSSDSETEDETKKDLSASQMNYPQKNKSCGNENSGSENSANNNKTMPTNASKRSNVDEEKKGKCDEEPKADFIKMVEKEKPDGKNAAANSTIECKTDGKTECVEYRTGQTDDTIRHVNIDVDGKHNDGETSQGKDTCSHEKPNAKTDSFVQLSENNECNKVVDLQAEHSQTSIDVVTKIQVKSPGKDNMKSVANNVSEKEEEPENIDNVSLSHEEKEGSCNNMENGEKAHNVKIFPEKIPDTVCSTSIPNTVNTQNCAKISENSRPITTKDRLCKPLESKSSNGLSGSKSDEISAFGNALETMDVQDIPEKESSNVARMQKAKSPSSLRHQPEMSRHKPSSNTKKLSTNNQKGMSDKVKVDCGKGKKEQAKHLVGMQTKESHNLISGKERHNVSSVSSASNKCSDKNEVLEKQSCCTSKHEEKHSQKNGKLRDDRKLMKTSAVLIESRRFDTQGSGADKSIETEVFCTDKSKRGVLEMKQKSSKSSSAYTVPKVENRIDVKQAVGKSGQPVLSGIRLSPERALREVTSFHLESYKIPKRKPECVQNKDRNKNRSRETKYKSDKVTQSDKDYRRNEKLIEDQLAKHRDKRIESDKTELRVKASRQATYVELKKNASSTSVDLKSCKSNADKSKQKKVVSKEFVSSSDSSEFESSDSSETELNSDDNDRLVEAIFGKSGSSGESEKSIKQSDICRTRTGDSTECSDKDTEVEDKSGEKIIARKRVRKISSDTETDDHLQADNSENGHRDSGSKDGQKEAENEFVSPRTNVLQQAKRLVSEMIESKGNKEKAKQTKESACSDEVVKNTKASQVSAVRTRHEDAENQRKTSNIVKEQKAIDNQKPKRNHSTGNKPCINGAKEKSNGREDKSETACKINKNTSPSDTKIDACKTSEKDIGDKSKENKSLDDKDDEKKEKTHDISLSLELHADETVLDFIDCNEEMSFGEPKASSEESDSDTGSGSSSSSTCLSSSEEGELSDEDGGQVIQYKRSPKKPFKLFQENPSSPGNARSKVKLNFSSVGGAKFSPIKFPTSPAVEGRRKDIVDSEASDFGTPRNVSRSDKRKHRSDSNSDTDSYWPVIKQKSSTYKDKLNTSTRRSRRSSSLEDKRRSSALSRSKLYESPRFNLRQHSRSSSPNPRLQEKSSDRENGRDKHDRREYHKLKRRRPGLESTRHYRSSSRDSYSEKDGNRRETYTSRGSGYKSRLERRVSESSESGSEIEKRTNKVRERRRSDDRYPRGQRSPKVKSRRDVFSRDKKCREMARKDPSPRRKSKEKSAKHKEFDKKQVKRQSEKINKNDRVNESDHRQSQEHLKGKDKSDKYSMKSKFDNQSRKRRDSKRYKKGHNSSSDFEELRTRETGRKRKHVRSSTDYERDSDNSTVEDKSKPIVKKVRKDV